MREKLIELIQDISLPITHEGRTVAAFSLDWYQAHILAVHLIENGVVFDNYGEIDFDYNAEDMKDDYKSC